MKPNPTAISYLLAVLAVPLVLHFHLLPAVFAGLAVHVLTVKLARRLPTTWGGMEHKLALAMILICVILGLFGSIFGLWSFVHGHHGMAALLAAAAETIDNLKRNLPAEIAASLPETVEDLREEISEVLHENGKNISTAGIAGFKTFAHVLLGMVVGGMTALHLFDDVENCPSWSPPARPHQDAGDSVRQGGLRPGEDLRPQHPAHCPLPAGGPAVMRR